MGRTRLRSLLDVEENLWQTKVTRYRQIIINRVDLAAVYKEAKGVRRS
jgi:hypothetical protein